MSPAMRWAARVVASPSLEHLSPVGAGGEVFHRVRCQEDSCGGCYPAASSPRGLVIAAHRGCQAVAS